MPDDIDRLEAALAALAWGDDGMARGAGVTPQNVRHWRKRRKRLPEPVLLWVEKLAAFHIANPPPPAPEDWNKPAGPGIDIYEIDL